MASFSRRLARLDAARTAALLLALCVALGLAAYAFSAYYTTPTLGALVAAVAAFVIALAGVLYGWLPATGGLSD